MDMRVLIAVKILPEVDRAVEKVAFEQRRKKREIIEDALKAYVEAVGNNGGDVSEKQK